MTASLPHGLQDPLRKALRIGGIYLALSAAWIYFSDVAVSRLSTDPATIQDLQTAKGWVFVLASAALLVYLIHRELRRVEEGAGRFRALVEQTLVPVYVIRGGRFVYVNPALARLFGYEPGEMEESVPVADVVSPEDRDRVLGTLALREEGREESLHYQFEGVTRQGSPVRVEVYGTQVGWEGAPAVIGVLLDVSERDRLQRQILQSQKLETLGKLTGEVAHDFNNLLTAIIGPLDFAAEDLEEGSRTRRDVEEARDAARRAADLSRKLLTFSRQRPVVRKAVDVCRVIREMEPVLRRLIPVEVSLRLELSDAPCIVEIPTRDLEQILLNLVTNAGEALEDGGTIAVRAESTRVGPGDGGDPDGPGGTDVAGDAGDPDDGDGSRRYGWIEVEDDGPGMDERTAGEIFEPFFTTRDDGTGLGLSTVYGIVKQSGGDVELQTAPGEGARFRILLPLSHREEEEPAGKPVPRRPLEGGERILVVEDEDAVVAVMTRALRERGYDVVEARSRTTALKAVAREEEPFDLLLIDVQLPDGIGPDVAEAIVIEHPRIRVLYISGYSNESVVHRLADAEDVRLLEKPFHMDELLSAVREVLEGDAGGTGAGSSAG